MRLYIDPGTGSMLFATLIGLVGLAGYFIKGVWMKLRFILNGGKKTVNDENVIPFVIFSDDKRYWPVFEPVCRELDLLGFEIVYMTSSPDDPALKCQYKNVRAEFIGKGNRAFVRLNFLKATIVLSTTPGLDVYQWKRSKNVKYYIHIPHMPAELITYRMFGLDYYDAILMSGQCQIDDTRALEKLRGLPEKECTIVGIPYLDEMAKRLGATSVEVHPRTVLVAPSWGSNSLLNRFGNKLIDQLISSNYHIIVRPHPQSFTSEKALIDRLMNAYPDLEWNRDIDNFDVLNRSDILISDFSGVIFDFALVFDKPVICAYTDFDDSQFDAWWLDTPIWTATAIPRLGTILSESNLPQLKELIDSALEDQSLTNARCEIRDEIWANRGNAASLVAKYIINKYQALIAEPIEKSSEDVSQIPDSSNKEEKEAAQACTDSTVLNSECTESDDTHKTQLEIKKRKRNIIIVITVGIVWLASILIMRYNSIWNTENDHEHTDLNMMRAAENAALSALKDGRVTEKSEFWVNSHVELVPTLFDKPKPYGSGTSMIGGAAKDFYVDGVPYYDYDEARDYTGKIVKITIAPETREITVEWVDGDSSPLQ